MCKGIKLSLLLYFKGIFKWKWVCRLQEKEEEYESLGYGKTCTLKGYHIEI